MKFVKTKFKEVYLIEIEKQKDRRGFFGRTYCKNEFKKNGIKFNVVQSNISYNKKRGTIRGMHFQAAPNQETKLVQCIQGAIYDVIIDLRRGSGTRYQWQAFNLNDNNNLILYVPKGFAHGFQTLKANTCIYYHMSEYYNKESAKGILWNDPYFNIAWPDKNKQIISEQDLKYPLFKKNL